MKMKQTEAVVNWFPEQTLYYDYKNFLKFLYAGTIKIEKSGPARVIDTDCDGYMMDFKLETHEFRLVVERKNPEIWSDMSAEDRAKNVTTTLIMSETGMDFSVTNAKHLQFLLTNATK